MDQAVLSVSTPLAPSLSRGAAPEAWSPALARLRLAVFLAIVFGGAFLIRVLAVLALRDVHAGPSPQFGADPVEFDSLAWRVAQGAGYISDLGRPTSFRAPGFPFFLSGLYAVGGHHYPLVYLAMCALGAVSCVLTYFVASELLPDRAARLAAVLAVFYVPHVYFSTLLLSENLFVPLLALAAWLFLRHLRDGSFASALGTGVCLGAAVLTRPFALLLLPIAIVILLVQQRRWSQVRGWLAAAAMVVCAAAVVGPWTLRNGRVHHHLVLVATNGGSTFYGGNNDKVASISPAIGTWVSTRGLPGRERVEAAPNEVEHDQIEWKLGAQWVGENAARLPLLLSAKAVRLILPDVDSANRKYVLLNLLGYTPFLLLILRGGARCLRERALRNGPWLLIHGIMLATLLTALIFWGSPRFRDANMPILMVYAALGLPACREAKISLADGGDGLRSRGMC